MRFRWWRRRVFLAIMIVYVLVMIFGGCADRFVLQPSTQPIDVGPVERRDIQQGGRTIEVFTSRSPALRGSQEPRAFVLEFCGAGTRAEQITRYLADRWRGRPVEVWVMNYPGYGRSTGPARLRSIPPAALAVFDELACIANGRPIFIAGASLGSAPALYVAAHRHVSGLMIQSPPPLQRMILRRHGWWNLWLVAGPVALGIPSELNSMSNAPNGTSPALFVLNGKDSVVPIEYQRAVEGAYSGPKRVLLRAESDHNDPIEAQDEKALQEGLDWLWSQVFEKSVKQ